MGRRKTLPYFLKFFRRNIMLTVKQGIRLSAIVDKLEIKVSDPNAGQAQVGADLMMQVVTKAHKAENEIYAFVADIKKCTTEEAMDVDLIQFIQALLADSGAMSFFKSAASSEDQG
jgi:hypothetical protein